MAKFTISKKSDGYYIQDDRGNMHECLDTIEEAAKACRHLNEREAIYTGKGIEQAEIVTLPVDLELMEIGESKPHNNGKTIKSGTPIARIRAVATYYGDFISFFANTESEWKHFHAFDPTKSGDFRWEIKDRSFEPVVRELIESVLHPHAGEQK